MLTHDQSWAKICREMSASPEEVHLWKASLDQPESILDALAASLSANERCRAGRFCFERDRRRFIAARGVLRDILGRYLRVPAESVSLATLEHGKPELADRSGNGLQFNLSHSHDLAVYAITCRRRVGVDIERVRTMSIDAMARLVFSPDECNTLSGLPPSEMLHAFLAGWTRKEAYVKAKGEGFAIPLNSFEVSMAPNVPPALVRNRHDPSDVGRWILRDVEPAADYIGAVAVEGDGWRLTTSHWEPLSRSSC